MNHSIGSIKRAQSSERFPAKSDDLEKFVSLIWETEKIFVNFFLKRESNT
jgi:hypothetical protein